MRLFLALNLPPDVALAAHAAAEPLRRAAPGVSWVPAERLHLTVKFLGERPAEEVEPLAGAVGEVVRHHAQVALDLGGVGGFPQLRRPRVVWLGVAPDPRLELLHHDVEMACAALGHAVEGRAFRPHVTLARVRPAAKVDGRALATAAADVHFRATVPVATLDLMQSEPARSGVRYSALARLPLSHEST